MKPIRRTEFADLILMLAVLFGAFVRFNSTLLAGFAINDGGMFSVMVDDLKASRYTLPIFTTFNHLNIPFAYPPLGFYLGRIACDLFGWTAPEALRWVPAFFASLSVPAFYVLALRLLKNKYHAALSALFFALMPRAFSTFVWGGGITRSPGQFFMLLAIATLIHLYEKNRRADIFWAGLFGGLAVMSHLEAALHTFVSAVFFWIMLSRSRTSLMNSIAVGAIVLLVSAPWWVTVLYHHGMAPFLNAAQAGGNVLSVFHLLFFAFTGEVYATLIAVLGLIGIAHRLIRRNYVLPLWMAIPFLLEGRNAASPAVIPLAMLAAVGLVDVVYAALHPKVENESPQNDQVSSIERNVLLYLLLYLIFSTSQFGWQLSSATLYPPEQVALKWIRENTPNDARFLVLTGTSSVSCDSVLEWFPAMANRHSIFTVQGAEWTRGAGFNDFVKSTYAVQQCLPNGDVSCLDAAVSRSAYDFIYVSKTLRVDNCAPLPNHRTFPYFVASLRDDNQFIVIYETDDVLISKKE
jgi:Dolichyl-phosphate-mannose-protein mannosyltransferase